MRVDDAGDTLWTETIPTVPFGGATSVVQTRDRGFLVAGMVAGSGPNGSTVYLARLSTDPNSVQPRIPSVPTYCLSQNYPNPFNSSTHIRIEIPRASRVTLTIYNSLGEKVSVVVDDLLRPGNHVLRFNAGDLSSGNYFYQLYTESHREIRMMTLVK
jgi:hypothetical protein